MNINMKLIGKSATAFATAITIATFFKDDSKVGAELAAQVSENSLLTKKISAYAERTISDSLIKTKIYAQTEHINNLKSQSLTSFETLSAKLKRLQSDPTISKDSILEQLSGDIEWFKNDLVKENKAFNDLYLMADKALLDPAIQASAIEASAIEASPMPENVSESGIGSEIFENISNIFSSYSEFLDTLSKVQLGALSNLLLTFLMLWCLISLIVIFFSDYIIKRLDLTNYPRIKKALDLRSKFQVYYFIFNALMILVCGLALLFVNVSLFLNY